jgi:CSLREA domain-containing protein
VIGESITNATASANVTFVNNLIGNLTASAATGSNAIQGISITGSATTATFNVFYNTVYLNNTTSGAGFGSSGISALASATATTSTLNLRNNVIVNTSVQNGAGLTVAYRRSLGTAGTLANYASTSNNNDFFAGTPSATNLIYADGTSTAQTITAYKGGVFTAGTISPRDSGSFTENPPFLSTTGSSANFLHINTATPTQLESGGAPIAGITDDFDGNTRNASTPDVGADEFAGVILDLTAPSISYTAFLNTSSTANRNLGATITDASGVAGGANSPRIYFKKSTDASYVSTQCTGAYSCTIDYTLVGGGSVIAGDTIQYFVVAQDTPGNVGANPGGGFSASNVNSVSTPPTTPNSYKIVATISGSFNAGTGETYTSLTNAGGIFEFINNSEVAGNITVNITTDLTAETGLNALNEFASPFTITIKPSGAARVVSGAAASTALIRLNGASRVTIDGSTSGGTDRSLTISNTSVTAPQVVRFGNIGTTPITGNTLKNSIVINGVNTSSAVVLTDSAGAAGYWTNTTIQNNDIRKAFIGVFSNAAVVAGNGSGTVYTQNKVDNAGADAMLQVALYAQGIDGATISNNTIGNFVNTDTNADTGIWLATSTVNTTVSGNTVSTIGNPVTGSSAINYGIRESSGAAASGNVIRQNTVSNINHFAGASVIGIAASSGGVTIDRNNVSGINNLSTGTFGAYGIDVQAGNNSVVKNNFVSNVTGDMSGGAAFSTTFGIFGIRVGAGTGHQIYNNSVNMYGLRAGTATTNLLTAAICVVSTASTGMDIRNNILANNITGGTTSIANVAAYLPSAGTSAMNLTWNNNSYYFGTDAAAGAGQAGTTAGTNFFTTLSAMAAYSSTLHAAATNDNASISSTGAVPYTTSTNLHITNTAAEFNTGATIATVTNDIDGDPRPQSSGYDLGADEVFVATPTATSTSTATSTNTATETATATNTSTPTNTTTPTFTPTPQKFFVDTTADTQDLTPGDGLCLDSGGFCSLRAAITEANFAAGANTISLPAGTYTQSLVAAAEDANAGGDWDIRSDVIINGSGSGTTFVQSNAAPGVATERVFHIVGTTATQVMNVNINNLTVRNGGNGTNLLAGAGIRVGQSDLSTYTFDNLVITDNRNPTSGGGLAISGPTTPTVNITNCTISNNTAGSAIAASDNRGAGLYNAAAVGAVNVTNTTISGNVSTPGITAVNAIGGGYYTQGAATTFTNSIITGNTARVIGAGFSGGVFGGGISALAGSITFNGSTVSNNTAQVTTGGAGSATGAGMYTQSTATMILNNTSFTGNTGTGTGGSGSAFGGGITVQGGTVTVQNNSSVTGNTTSRTGGSGRGFAAGIYNQQATLNVIDSSVSGNTASDFHAGIRTLASTGAAATTNITRSTVGGNTANGSNSGASEGGGVVNIAGGAFVATTNISSSTVSGNHAWVLGAPGPGSGSTAGGIENYNTGTGAAVVNLTNSTVSGNDADVAGGIYTAAFGAGAGAVNADYSTIARNDATDTGGGIYQESTGTTNLRNSVVGDNTGAIGPDIFGSITSQDYNHIEDLTDGTFAPMGNDVTGSDALLGPLANNGGTTQTHLPGYVVANLIPNGTSGCGTTVTLDQRGLGRPFPGGGSCDKGSVESQVPLGPSPTSTNTSTPTSTATNTATSTPTFTPTPTKFFVDTTADTQDAAAGDGNCLDGSGFCSLRAAITEANALAGPQTISLPAGTYTQSLVAANEDLNAGGDYDITSDVIINGAGSGTTFVEANAAPATATERVFHVLGATAATALNVNINNLTVRNGGNNAIAGNAASVAASTGAGIRLGQGTGSVITLNNLVISGNKAVSRGGGIAVDAPTASTVNITNCAISGNSSGSAITGTAARGAGITVGASSSAINITNTTITGNTAVSGVNGVGALGGGLYSGGSGVITFANSSVSNNTASTAFAGSSGQTSGGGIAFLSGTVTLQNNSVVSGNTASSTNGVAFALAGAILNQQGTLNVIDSSVTGNTASDFRGGIYSLAINVPVINNITRSTISGNTAQGIAGAGAEGDAGGLAVISNGATASSTTNITSSTISGNHAWVDGAAGADTLAGGIENVSFVAGGISVINLTNSTVSGNDADNAGGIFNQGAGATINLDYSTVAANDASIGGLGGGGGLYNTTGTINLRNSVVADNTAPSAPDIAGTITSQDYNHVQDTTDGTFVAMGNDVVDTTAAMGTLASNGGSTQTHLPGYPVADLIPNGTSGCGTTVTLDQRGLARPAFAGCDKGSVESQVLLGASPTNTATPSATNTNTATPSATSTSTATATATSTATFTPTPGCGANNSLSGAQEVPANASPGTGSVTASLNAGQTTLSVVFNWTGLTAPANASHIHGPAAAGANGGVVFGFSGFPTATSGSHSQSFPISPAQVSDFLAGLYYINIHTSAFPGGEIRAQLTPTCVSPTPTNTATFTPTNTPTDTPTDTPTPADTPSVSGVITYGNAIGNPVPPRFVKNVSVASSSGSPPVGPVLTGLNGQYTLTGFGTGAYTIKPTKPGGPNAAINSFDAARVAQGVTGSVPFVSQNQRFTSDVNASGSVTSNDAANIARFAAGLPPNVGTIVGSWRFFVTGAPSPLPTAPQTYNDSRTYNNIFAPGPTDQDYVALLVGEASGNYNTATHPRGTVAGGRMSDVGEDGRAAEGSITVTAQPAVTEADKVILIPVAVEGVKGKDIISYEFNLRYDPTVIQPLEISADLAGTVSRGLRVVTNPYEPGLLRVVVYGSMPIEEDGVLLNLRFTGVGPAGSISLMTFERIMFNDGEPRASAADGMVELF